jgi:hypothetical protein
MGRTADIIVTSPDDTPQLAVEVKNKSDTTPEWAAQLRRNLLVHGVFPRTPFFMLALPDRLYLWKHKDTGWDAPADYVIDAADLLTPYSGADGTLRASVTQYALELMISAWLNDLIRAEQIAPDEKLSWLSESGLFDAIRHGTLHTEAGV